MLCAMFFCKCRGSSVVSAGSAFARFSVYVCLGLIARFQTTELVCAKDVFFSTREKVGQVGTNVYYTPANQLLTPAGLQVELPGMRPQAIALSPDGKLLVTSGKMHDLVVIDPVSGEVLQRVAMPAGKEAEQAG